MLNALRRRLPYRCLLSAEGCVAVLSKEKKAMKWEQVGRQELWETGVPGKGYAYQVWLWRSPVPGGWLLMAVNAKSNGPDPVVSFYPDPEHRWNPTQDPQADYLLRPAQGSVPVASDPAALPDASPGEIRQLPPSDEI